MAKPDPAEESRSILSRVHRESETILGSSVRRASDHLSGRDKDGTMPDDPAERWGRLAGRWLAIIIAIGCLIWLLR